MIFWKDFDIDTNDKPGYIDQRKFKSMAQEAQQRIHELDAIRNGYQQIVDAYQDLYQQYHDRHLLSSYYETNPMKLGELQAESPKKKKVVTSFNQKDVQSTNIQEHDIKL